MVMAVDTCSEHLLHFLNKIYEHFQMYSCSLECAHHEILLFIFICIWRKILRFARSFDWAIRSYCRLASSYTRSPVNADCKTVNWVHRVYIPTNYCTCITYRCCSSFLVLMAWRIFGYCVQGKDIVQFSPLPLHMYSQNNFLHRIFI